MKTTHILAIALSGLIAAPALAQTTPPPPQAGTTMEAGEHDGRYHGMGQKGMGHRGMFQSLSPEGRQTMVQAMRDAREDVDRTQIRAARERVGTILAADKLDVTALRNAMDAERRLVDARHKVRQDAMLAAFQKLSAADRKAFVADAKAGADRMKSRMEKRRDRRAAAAVVPD